MKRSIIPTCMAVMCVMSLYAMDTVNSYVSLAETTFSDIRDQHQVIYQKVDSGETDYSALFSLSLCKMCEHSCTMSDYDKHLAINGMPAHFFMSENVLLLLGSVMILPQELVKDYICLFLFDGHKAAAEQFYTDPIEQAFDLYHAIRVGLSDDSKPIGPLYVASQSERDAILSVKKLWYYSLPIIDSEEKKLLNAVSDRLKRTYLQGREVIILPHDVCTLKQVFNTILISGGMTLLSFGGIAGVVSLMGMFFGTPLATASNYIALITDAACTGFCGSCGCLCMATKGLCDLYYHSERIII